MERHDKRLTEHFCLDEFTYSGIAVDNAINNQPPPCACLALQNLAVGLLEPLRLLYGGRRFLHLSLKINGNNRMQVLVYMLCVVCMFCSCGALVLF